jgi:hypothetical protein
MALQFRSIDGSHNNLADPTMNQTDTDFARVGPSQRLSNRSTTGRPETIKAGKQRRFSRHQYPEHYLAAGRSRPGYVFAVRPGARGVLQGHSRGPTSYMAIEV